MKSNGMVKYVIFSALGLIMMIGGLVITKLQPDAQGIMLTLPYVCFGIGAGVFGGNLGMAIQKYMLNKDFERAKKIEIEQKDERNITIANKAKAKAYDFMIMIFSGVILAFTLLQVELYVLLALIAVYLLIIFTMIYWLNKYQKEM